MEKTNDFIEKMATELPTMAATVLLMAKLHKIAYDALVQQGFSEKQALEIIKARGATL